MIEPSSENNSQQVNQTFLNKYKFLKSIFNFFFIVELILIITFFSLTLFLSIVSGGFNGDASEGMFILTIYSYKSRIIILLGGLSSIVLSFNEKKILSRIILILVGLLSIFIGIFLIFNPIKG